MKAGEFLVEEGWHTIQGKPMLIVKDAKTFQTPAPKYQEAEYPLRSSFAVQIDSSRKIVGFEVLEEETPWPKKTLTAGPLPEKVNPLNGKASC